MVIVLEACGYGARVGHDIRVGYGARVGGDVIVGGSRGDEGGGGDDGAGDAGLLQQEPDQGKVPVPQVLGPAVHDFEQLVPVVLIVGRCVISCVQRPLCPNKPWCRPIHPHRPYTPEPPRDSRPP